ncbi:MAG TPA: hypothetical protein DEB12_13425 [Porphyromonadaceae bacterium]|jgi:hypothetical protein|nr:hypothetical protein [Porphyromonadaceae bacterium]
MKKILAFISVLAILITVPSWTVYQSHLEAGQTIKEAKCQLVQKRNNPYSTMDDSIYVIKYQHKLPSMNINGRNNGSYNNEEMGMPSLLTTKDTRLGEFIHQLRNVIFDDRRLVFIDGKILMCSKNWIRDHVHEMKAFKHWEYDNESFLNFIIETQSDEGFFYELIKQYDDYHWKMVNEDCFILYPDDNLTLVRLELEADVEYLVVEGAMQCYRVNGDKEWLKKILASLEKGIDYSTSSPKRWDAERGLVKRPFTIDTWDFTYNTDTNNRRIEDNTPMSIMHGDNSGVYQAMGYLSYFNRLLGNHKKAKEWDERAAELKRNMFKYLWNANYFIHQLHLNHNGADTLENVRLSLSNTYNMNRGVTNLEQSRAIIEEYIVRRETTESFAEWFSIDPPYQNGFSGHPPGKYVNGAISPFAAGELAKAAFNNGYEKYGWDIISRFIELMEHDKTIYFLYSPVDKTPQGGGPSAWGAAALMSAIDEGLAGIVDMDTGYKKISFSPRFVVTEYEELRYITGYEKTATLVDTRFIITDKGMRYDIISPATEIEAHILLPDNRQCNYLLVNSVKTPFKEVKIGDSRYLDVKVDSEELTTFEIIWED